jgi:hypothetical protein
LSTQYADVTVFLSNAWGKNTNVIIRDSVDHLSSMTPMTPRHTCTTLTTSTP